MIKLNKDKEEIWIVEIDEDIILRNIEKKLEQHWKNTKKERERTHTTKIYKNYLENHNYGK